MSSKYVKKRQVGNKTELVIDYLNFPILYKYYSIKEHSVNALFNDEIWATIPSHFNDPYDSVVCFDERSVKKYIKDNLTNERFEKYQYLFNTNSKTTIIENIACTLANGFKQARDIYAIACFSEDVNSEIMWAHYANNAKGFALAYDGKLIYELSKSCYQQANEIIRNIDWLGIGKFEYSNPQNDLVTILPIQYCSGKVCADTRIKKSIDFLFNFYDTLEITTDINPIAEIFKKMKENKYIEEDNSFIYSTFGVKNTCWRYEKEWRILTYNLNPFNMSNSPYICIGNLTPKALYLGEYISEYDKLALIEIAKQKGLPVYQMKTKMYKNRCKLIPILIQET